MRARPLNSKKIIVDALKKYHTMSNVARHLGVTRMAVSYALKRFNIPYDAEAARLNRLFDKKLNRKRDALIINKALQGKHVTDIASEVKCPYYVVSSVLKREHLFITHRRNKTYISIYRLYLKGYPINDIADIFGINFSNISRIIRVMFFGDGLRRGQHRRRLNKEKVLRCSCKKNLCNPLSVTRTYRLKAQDEGIEWKGKYRSSDGYFSPKGLPDKPIVFDQVDYFVDTCSSCGLILRHSNRKQHA